MLGLCWAVDSFGSKNHLHYACRDLTLLSSRRLSHGPDHSRPTLDPKSVTQLDTIQHFVTLF